MAKDETTPGGLFSKVVKFVRNQGTQWNDIDDPSSIKDGGLSKQALKEMIERKRRNDFVRKREFDMLRKLRRREASGGGAMSEAARPSFFQSSLPSRPDDRAMTLKKIDEIEAQMSMQWWKTKHGAGGANSALNTSSDFPVSNIPSRPPSLSAAESPPTPEGLAYARTAPVELGQAIKLPPVQGTMEERPVAGPRAGGQQPASIQAPQASGSLQDDNALDFTGDWAPAKPQQKGAQQPHAPSAVIGSGGSSKPAPQTPIPQPRTGDAPRAADPLATASSFSNSKLFAVEVGEVQHDPELEEASIRFANGDDAGAEAGLLEAIGAKGARHQHEETWLTLFDFYRATGRHDRFEEMAIDFASKFGRSSPMWFSLPELVGKLGAAPLAAAPTGKPDWRSPAVFGIQSMAALNAAISKSSGAWTLDWTALQSVDADACVPLTKLFSTWASQPVTINLLGGAQLEAALRQAAVSGNRSVAQERWFLLLAYLRVAHRADEFELAALDFCVTFEVSPPAWESAKCKFNAPDMDANSADSQTIVGETVHDSIVSELQTATGPSTMSAQLASVELSGQVMGEPKPVLDKLEARLAGADVMIISCAKLIRVDFSAAGSLLNWVTARQTEGRIVHFTEVNRLVAAFFHVIGISEHARVGVRMD